MGEPTNVQPGNRRPPFTCDSFFGGRLRLKQHRYGYRFSIDAVILADAVRPRPGDAVVDLGTGCGIIPLALAFRHPDIRIWGVEIQPALAALAAENVQANDMGTRVSILPEDMRSVSNRHVQGAVDVVVSNPPFRRGRSGRINPDGERALARHEIAITLPELVQAARRLLRTGGRFITIYAAERLAELIDHLRRAAIEPKRLRSVHSSSHQEARLVLVEGVKGAGPGITISAPLIVYGPANAYTEEIQHMLRP